MDLGKYSTFIIDWDGTLVRGEGEVPGAASLLRSLLDAGRDICIASNNSQRTGAELSRNVARIHGVSGVPAVTVCDIASSAIRDLVPGGDIAVLGSETLVHSCRESGARLVPPLAPTCDAVVLGYHESICWKHLEWLVSQIERGAIVLATNADPFRMGDRGVRLPETGSIFAALEAFVDPVWQILGKPEPALVRAALARLGSRPECAVMIGDRLDTDVACAGALGMGSVWLSPDRVYERDQDGDALVVSDLSQIRALLPGGHR